MKKLDFSFKKISFKDVLSEYEILKLKKKIPRVVFLLTLNGRSVRQIFRLVKTIYDETHFYYFHIDQVNLAKLYIPTFLPKIFKANDLFEKKN